MSWLLSTDQQTFFIHSGLLVHRNLHFPGRLNLQLTNSFEYHLLWKFLHFRVILVCHIREQFHDCCSGFRLCYDHQLEVYIIGMMTSAWHNNYWKFTECWTNAQRLPVRWVLHLMNERPVRWVLFIKYCFLRMMTWAKLKKCVFYAVYMTFFAVICFLRAASPKYQLDLEIPKKSISPNSPTMKPYGH